MGAADASFLESVDRQATEVLRSKVDGGPTCPRPGRVNVVCDERSAGQSQGSWRCSAAWWA